MAGLSSENKLRDVFNPRNIASFAESIERNCPDFERESFLSFVLPKLDDLGFGERSVLIRDALGEYLPKSFPKAVRVLLASLGPELNGAPAPLDSFIIWPQCAFVSKYGKDHFDISMNALYEMTKRFSAEGDLRTFIEADYERSMETLSAWCDDPNPDVRRLVSEGTRPRLPLTGRIRRFQKDPRPVIALLEKLKDDSSEYVRRSVANNMNDIAKDNPDIAIATLRKWNENGSPEVKRVVRHAARSLVKQGHPEVIEMLGYSTNPEVSVSKVTVFPESQRRGESVEFSFSIASRSKTDQKLIVDFVVHYRKAGGKILPKVFKLRNMSLPASKTVRIERVFALKNTSGRTIYPGKHAIEICINGKICQRGEFEVV